MSVSPLVLSQKRAEVAIKRNPTPPALISNTFWAITGESGCVPSPTQIAYNADTGEWWGGPFAPPLSEYESLVEDLPQVLQIGAAALDARLSALPHLTLFASSKQKESWEAEATRSTKPWTRAHALDCPESKPSICLVLDTEQERERAMAIFSFLANAFVFSHPISASGEPVRLPAVIAQPLLRLSDALGRQPITDYASSVLTNWELRDIGAPLSLENIRIPRSFTGTEAEKWFYAIHCVIEFQGGRAFRGMQHSRQAMDTFMMMRKLGGTGPTPQALALQRFLAHTKQFTVRHREGAKPAAAVPTTPLLSPPLATYNATWEDNCVVTCNKVTADLKLLSLAITDMTQTISRLPEHCPADIFFDKIRPWLSSWPDCGVVYLESCTCSKSGEADASKALKFSGASGAQSTLLPCIDAFLGISYQNSDHARTDLGAFIRQLKSFRKSMPPPHRDLVTRYESPSVGTVRDLISILDEYVLSKGEEEVRVSPLLLELKLAYNAVIESLVVFRRKHTDYATKYIKTMAAKRAGVSATASTSPVSAAAVAQPAVSVAAGRGTGGSDFSTHLARHVTDTKKSLYQVPPQ